MPQKRCNSSLFDYLVFPDTANNVPTTSVSKNDHDRKLGNIEFKTDLHAPPKKTSFQIFRLNLLSCSKKLPSVKLGFLGSEREGAKTSALTRRIGRVAVPDLRHADIHCDFSSPTRPVENGLLLLPLAVLLCPLCLEIRVDDPHIRPIQEFILTVCFHTQKSNLTWHACQKSAQRQYHVCSFKHSTVAHISISSRTSVVQTLPSPSFPPCLCRCFAPRFCCTASRSRFNVFDTLQVERTHRDNRTTNPSGSNFIQKITQFNRPHPSTSTPDSRSTLCPTQDTHDASSPTTSPMTYGASDHEKRREWWPSSSQQLYQKSSKNYVLLYLPSEVQTESPRARKPCLQGATHQPRTCSAV